MNQAGDRCLSGWVHRVLPATSPTPRTAPRPWKKLAYGGTSELQTIVQLEHATAHTARIYILKANRAQGTNDGQTKVKALIRRRAAKAQRDQE